MCSAWHNVWHLVSYPTGAAIDPSRASPLKRKVFVQNKGRVSKLGPRKLSMIVVAAWG